MKGNKPVNEQSSRIVIDDMETKQKLITIAQKQGETLKETVIRLVEKEYEKAKEGKTCNKH